ncbi:Zeatin o-glucosyltransferase [Thalictrum thalictroides]|uniref:Zeatin o-glucosyltransferase n=1 Tax=Thalictrum thalictroides TaxID=46969 RepID=A0A7J6WC58_THATH|nr:Zeatin o-glucosyltransferase [Thalictrum thalictroides]
MSQPSNYCVESPPEVVVVMVPLPAQGHLNQLLQLSRIISTRGIPVHFIGSSTHNRQAKDRVHGWDPSTTPNLHFHDFQLLTDQIVTPPPDPHASTKFPAHLLPTFQAGVQFREPLAQLLRALSTTNRRVTVVYDTLMGFAAREASFISNAEAYSFVACSAFSVLHFIWEMMGQPAPDQGGLFPEELPWISFEDCFSDGVTDFITKNSQWSHLCCAGSIYDTCNAIEGKFVNLIAQTQPDKKLWAIGPFNPVTFDSSPGSSRHCCLEWLDKQPPDSVIYVSFGTTTSLSDDQIAELAIGLERSEQRFIWVLRDADRGDIYTEEGRKPQLSDGFEDRIKGVGMKLMVLDEGKVTRKNASELRTNIREAMSEGGTSAIQLEAFLSHISR